MRHRFELTDATRLTEVLDAVERAVTREMSADELGGEIRLMAEEALTNVIKYAYDGAPSSTIAEVHLSLSVEEILLEIRDDGKPFDPLEQPAPDVDAPMEDKTEGGLGIYLMRNLADEVLYRREHRTNVLLIRKRIG